MLKRLMVEERGFTLVELLVTISILAVLFGIVTLTLGGLGSNAEDTVEAAEVEVVQSAVDIYMANQNVGTLSTTRASGSAATIADGDAPWTQYLRSTPTRCDYWWDASGDVTQSSCP